VNRGSPTYLNDSGILLKRKAAARGSYHSRPEGGGILASAAAESGDRGSHIQRSEGEDSQIVDAVA